MRSLATKRISRKVGAGREVVVKAVDSGMVGAGKALTKAEPRKRPVSMPAGARMMAAMEGKRTVNLVVPGHPDWRSRKFVPAKNRLEGKFHTAATELEKGIAKGFRRAEEEYLDQGLGLDEKISKRDKEELGEGR